MPNPLILQMGGGGVCPAIYRWESVINDGESRRDDRQIRAAPEGLTTRDESLPSIPCQTMARNLP